MSFRLSLLSLLLAGNTLAAGITNVTSTQVGSTTSCYSYPYWDAYTDSTGIFSFAIANAEDSSLNGFRATKIETVSPAMVGTLARIDAAYNGYHCIKGIVSDPYVNADSGPIFFSGDADNQQLVYTATGPNPETYNVEIDGVAISGTFVGFNNVTTWGFTFVPASGVAGSYDAYSMRLLGPDTTQREGEIAGFLSVIG